MKLSCNKTISLVRINATHRPRLENEQASSIKRLLVFWIIPQKKLPWPNNHLSVISVQVISITIVRLACGKTPYP